MFLGSKAKKKIHSDTAKVARHFCCAGDFNR